MHTRKQAAYIYLHLLLAVLCNAGSIYGQREYLVTLDINNGSFRKLDSIPGVKWISSGGNTIDQLNSRFFLLGAPDHLNWSLITVDAVSGKTIFKAPVKNRFLGMRYSNSMNKLVGVDKINNVFHVVSIDPQTAMVTSIAAIPGMEGITWMLTDDLHKRAIIGGVGSGGRYMYIVDIQNGSLISATPVNGNFTALAYDNTAGKLYGLSAVYNPNTWYSDIFVCEVDPLTGAVHHVSNMPLADIRGISQNSHTYIEKGRKLIVAGADASNQSSFFVIDVDNARIINKLPAHLTSHEAIPNIIQYQYDNKRELLYALHWEPSPLAVPPILPVINPPVAVVDSTIAIYPNPVRTTITIRKPAYPARFRLYTLAGQLISDRPANNTVNQLGVSQLAKGVYIYKLYSGGLLKQSGRIIKQ